MPNSNALSLVVEEPVPGQFHWLVVQHTGRWICRTARLVAQSMQPLATYLEAQEAGNRVRLLMGPEAAPPLPSGFGGMWEVRTVMGGLEAR